MTDRDLDEPDRYDLDRMQDSIESGAIEIPSGLTRDDRRAWINKNAGRPTVYTRPNDLAVEESFDITFDRYADSLKRLSEL